MAKVTGIGGVFLRAKDPQTLAAWYAEHLGLQPGAYGSVNFVWDDCPAPEGKGMTVWSLFPADTTYFGPGRHSGLQQAMLNYRVDDLDGLLHQLSAAGVEIDPHREDHEYGRFAWIYDPEGNRLELWQPLPLQGEQQKESLT